MKTVHCGAVPVVRLRDGTVLLVRQGQERVAAKGRDGQVKTSYGRGTGIFPRRRWAAMDEGCTWRISECGVMDVPEAAAAKR
jgi:hypothetical protein